MSIEEETDKVFGCMKGAVIIEGDIISPIDEKWDVEEVGWTE